MLQRAGWRSSEGPIGDKAPLREPRVRSISRLGQGSRVIAPSIRLSAKDLQAPRARSSMHWVLHEWKVRVEQLKLEVLALFLVCRNSGTPWPAKTIAMGIFGYAVSPFDLIPDPVPFIGYLDDAAVLLLGLMILPRMIPSAVLADCRNRARRLAAAPVRWVAGSLIVANWLVAATTAAYLTLRAIR